MVAIAALFAAADPRKRNTVRGRSREKRLLVESTVRSWALDDVGGFATRYAGATLFMAPQIQSLAQAPLLCSREGGLQSNHVRQTTAAEAKAGLKCHLVLVRGACRPTFISVRSTIPTLTLRWRLKVRDPGDPHQVVSPSKA